MPDKQTIFVTGATGNQGGAVVRSLLQKGFLVKALTRNIHSARSQALEKLHVIVVKGNLNNADSYKEHLKGVHGIFSVQTFEHGVKEETAQGITLANTAKEFAVE